MRSFFLATICLAVVGINCASAPEDPKQANVALLNDTTITACDGSAPDATTDATVDAAVDSATDSSVVDSGTPVDSGPTTSGSWWKPSSATPLSFHWQLSNAFSFSRDYIPNGHVFDVDGEDTPASEVAKLHTVGAKAICYVDVGTYEDYRSDAASFPASVLGNTNGWPGERWLDLRQLAILLPIMQARFQNWCLNKGFDAIEPDNLDAYQNSSGFPITRADNIAYIKAIANLAHSMNLSIGQKNAVDDISTLLPYFDWVLNEQCFQYSECANLSMYANAGKAVWNVEYRTAGPNCLTANPRHWNAQRRDLNLKGPTQTGYVYSSCESETASTW